MDYWYLGLLLPIAIIGIIYLSRRGSTATVVQDGDTLSEMPILFGYTDELRVWQSGRLIIQQAELIIIDDNNDEQLRMSIDQTLDIALRTFDPFNPPFWDIKDRVGRILRFKVKMPLAVFLNMHAIADHNERLLHTLHKITGTEFVRVMAIAQPSFMRIFEIVRWVILTLIFLLLVFVLYRG